MSLNLFAGFCGLLANNTGQRVRQSFGAHAGPIAAGELTLQECDGEREQVGPEIMAALVAHFDNRTTQKRGVVYTEPAEAKLLCRLAVVRVLAQHLGQQHERLLSRLVFVSDGEGAHAELKRLGLAHRAAQFLRELRVLDPACGAGTLLVTMFTQLDQLLARLAPQVKASVRRARIIENSLFGVDVNPWALTVTRLRLSLASHGAVDGSSDFQLLHGDCLLSEFQCPFDLIVGNPPYVRHEQIRDPLGTLAPAAYKHALTARTKTRLPQLFAQHKLSRACDLYVYFYFLGLALLKEGGALCFVSSSSWLDVAFAASLRSAVAAHLALLIDHDRNRSFAAADVNTVIALLSASPTNGANFVRVELPFAQLLPEHLEAKRHVSRADLARHARAGWGARFLRAPASFTRLAHGLRPLGTQFSIGRGRRTGHDAFFYLSAEDIERFAIEQRFLRPLIKSPSEFAAHRQTKKLAPRRWLFLCEDEIDKLTGTGAAAYIAHKKARAYQLGEQATPDLLLPIAFHDRYFVAINDAGWQVHQRFATVRLTAEQKPLTKALAAVLSSNVLALFAETVGRHSLGQGALELPPTSWRAVPFPELARLPAARRDELATLWDALATEAPGHARRAALDPIHRRIDHIVCELLDVAPAVLGEVVRDRLALLDKRLAKAGKRRAGKKA